MNQILQFRGSRELVQRVCGIGIVECEVINLSCERGISLQGLLLQIEPRIQVF